MIRLRPTLAPSRLWRALVALLAVLHGACVAPEAPTRSSSTLRFVWTGDLTPLWHPAAYQTYSQGVIFWLVFNNLVKLNDDLKTLSPDLAESWEVSEDMTVFTFRLRKDVAWHDGRPFTARDVIFSFSRQVVETYRYVKYVDGVKGRPVILRTAKRAEWRGSSWLMITGFASRSIRRIPFSCSA